MKCRQIILFVIIILMLLCTTVYAVESNTENTDVEPTTINSSVDDENDNDSNTNNSNNEDNNTNTNVNNNSSTNITNSQDDNTVASESLPLTGDKLFILPIIIIAVLGFIFYKKYTEYGNF